MEFANRICPNCKNPNYVVFLGDFSKAFKYKCMNCNQYFNDNDTEEPLSPVWKSECMNSKVDMVEVVRCKDCKYAHLTYDGYCKYCDNITDDDGFPIERYHPGEWFCADGEKRTD